MKSIIFPEPVIGYNLDIQNNLPINHQSQKLIQKVTGHRVNIQKSVTLLVWWPTYIAGDPGTSEGHEGKWFPSFFWSQIKQRTKLLTFIRPLSYHGPQLCPYSAFNKVSLKTLSPSSVLGNQENTKNGGEG